MDGPRPKLSAKSPASCWAPPSRYHTILGRYVTDRYELFCPETGTSVPSRGRRRCSEPEAAVCVLSLQLRIPKLQQGTFFRRSLKRAGLRRRRWWR